MLCTQTLDEIWDMCQVLDLADRFGNNWYYRYDRRMSLVWKGIVLRTSETYQGYNFNVFPIVYTRNMYSVLRYSTLQ